jgi:hypothetical protein
VPVARPRVRNLQAKIRELEGKLESNSTSSETQSSQAELITTGRFDQLPPHNVVEEL